MNVEETKRQYLHKPLLIILLSIALISCLAIASAVPLISVPNTDPNSFWHNQIKWYIIGFIVLFIVYKFGNERVYSCVWIFYWFLMFLLVLLVIDHRGWLNIPFAQNINGATSWFVLPGGSIQPSEFMKMVLIVVLSKIVEEHNTLYPLHTFETDCKLLLKIAGATLPPCALIYLQNDAGVTFIILVSVAFLLFSSGLQMRWFIFGASVVLIAIIGLCYIFLFNQDLFKQIFSGHKAERFYGWLDPEGTHQNQGFQLFYALLSYGTASITGHGFQSYVMPFPEAYTDFIFAVIAQGAGLIGAFIVLGLIIALDVTILNIGLHSTERHRSLATGLFGILFIQQFWNLGMVTGLVPITGITLPLLSYGGSSLLSYMIMFGLIFDIEKQNRIKRSKILTYQ